VFYSCRGFKALKQIVKLLFKLGRREDMIDAYKCVSSMAAAGSTAQQHGRAMSAAA
jgi:hypothetical protein